jgi:hypothetical protein
MGASAALQKSVESRQQLTSTGEEQKRVWRENEAGEDCVTAGMSVGDGESSTVASQASEKEKAKRCVHMCHSLHMKELLHLPLFRRTADNLAHLHHSSPQTHSE